MILAAFVAAALAAPPSALSSADEAAIMRLLCEGKLTRDGRGWVCTDDAASDGNEPWQQRWQSAWRGRFVERPDEWIVTLYRTCPWASCPFDSSVVRKAGGKWIKVRALEIEEAIGHECLLLAGGQGVLDRLACLGAVGPNQGFMFEMLRVLSFAGGEVAEQTLMARGQGGECYLDPPDKEVRADEVELLADDGKALTVRLRVRAAPCDRAQPEGHGTMRDLAEHVLRFERDGAALKPDATTAALIRRYDWLQTP